jgi:pimeloyl-ACP methyl ester carboxylesterase
MDLRGHGESAKPDHGYDFASVSGDVAGVIQAKNLSKPIVAGHSWGGDVALELAVAYPGVPGGLCFVDGGMIEPSTRYQSLDDAREQMAPPDFTGMEFDGFQERIQ